MKKLSDLFRQLTGHLGGKTPARPGQILVLINRCEVRDHPEAAHMIGLGLHDACTRRGLSSALVDIDEWVARGVLAEGRLDPDAWPPSGMLDLFTGEPARERAVKEEVVWFMRHRSRLVRSAFASGGDAEVVIALHELELFDIFMHAECTRLRKMVDLLVHPTGQGHPGFTVLALNRDLKEPLHFGVNAVDDAKTWDHLLEAVLRPRK